MPPRRGTLAVAGCLALFLVALSPQRAPAQTRAEVATETSRALVRTPPGPEDRQLPTPDPLPAREGGGAAELARGGALDAGIDGPIADAAPAPDGQARPPPPLDDAGCSAAGGAGGMALAGFLLATGLGFRRRRE